MSVTLSAGVRRALSSLQSTSTQAQQTQFRLATGKKVNSALDNPASFFTAAGLSNRASDLSRLLDNVGQAVQTLQTADRGIRAVSKLVENAQSIVAQARAAGPDTVEAGASITGGATAGALADGDTLTLNVNGTNTTVSFDSTHDTIAEFVTQLNTATGISATLSGTDITITTDTTGTAASISVVSASGNVLTNLGLTAGQSDTGTALVTRRADLARDFDALRTQIDQLAADSSFGGVNLLAGDSLQVTFNETGSSSLTIAGTDGSADGLNIDAAANSFASNADVTAAEGQLRAAAESLRTQASSFGSNLSIVQNRQEFTRNLISTLTEGADALTLADTNEEAANLLALQTRTQLSQTALSLSSQADQGVLRLF